MYRFNVSTMKTTLLPNKKEELVNEYKTYNPLIKNWVVFLYIKTPFYQLLVLSSCLFLTGYFVFAQLTKQEDLMLFAGFLLYSIFLIPVLRALEGFKKEFKNYEVFSFVITSCILIYIYLFSVYKLFSLFFFTIHCLKFSFSYLNRNKSFNERSDFIQAYLAEKQCVRHQMSTNMFITRLYSELCFNQMFACLFGRILGIFETGSSLSNWILCYSLFNLSVYIFHDFIAGFFGNPRRKAAKIGIDGLVGLAKIGGGAVGLAGAGILANIYYDGCSY
jgi:hypothetical protein